MGIPESQLETWSHQGSITNSSNTYNSIKSVLEADDTPYCDHAHEVFLQGSYGNDTNIYAESDVDIVILLNDCWQRDIASLTSDEQAAYKEWAGKGDYGHAQFKLHVLEVLKEEYGDDVKGGGDKAIAISSSGNRRKADVIAAVQFRRYLKFKNGDDQLFTPGICFWNKAGEQIVNYPKLHSSNLTRKHQDTGGWLKPMVRIVKNLRERMIGDGVLKAGVAPSYYLEGLLFNVPKDRFTASYEDCFVNAVKWIQSEAKKDKLVCANEQYYLLRDNSHVCWPCADADAFLEAAVKFWDDW